MDLNQIFRGPNSTMDSAPLQKSQPILQMEELFQNQRMSKFEDQIRLDELRKKLRQQYPNWSDMAIHLHATGLLNQEDTRGFQNSRQKSVNQRIY